MAKLKFTGEIGQDGDKFVIKIEIGAIPSQGEAQQIGKFLHETIAGYFEGKGASLLETPNNPGILRPN